VTRQDGAVHVARVVRKYQTKDGEDRQSVSHLLRRSFRDGGKIRHETLGNVSALPADALEALRASLAGETLVVAGTGLELTRALSHGHLAAVSVMAKMLGLRDLLGPPCQERDIAYALILARVVHPRPKLATTKWWSDTTLVADLELTSIGTDEVYAAMDWLGDRQDAIETKLATRHLSAEANPSRLAYFDLSSSWVEGTKNELAARGYSRDKKRGLAQIEYGLLTDKDGRPVAIEGDGPMGPTRMLLKKPVIAAVEGYAVAGGCELALWCDLRVISESAVFGIFCRRFGVPLIDLGTIRLPRLIGHSRAMDLILTGRDVLAQEALDIGLANRLVGAGEALPAAIELARRIASFPQTCLRNDRLSAIEQWGLEETPAMQNEIKRGLDTLASGEAQAGASAFSSGSGRHGSPRADSCS